MRSGGLFFGRPERKNEGKKGNGILVLLSPMPIRRVCYRQASLFSIRLELCIITRNESWPMMPALFAPNHAHILPVFQPRTGLIPHGLPLIMIHRPTNLSRRVPSVCFSRWKLQGQLITSQRLDAVAFAGDFSISLAARRAGSSGPPASPTCGWSLACRPPAHSHAQDSVPSRRVLAAISAPPQYTVAASVCQGFTGGRALSAGQHRMLLC